MPVDFELSTGEDFRSITSLELSGLLDGLTAKTRNVTAGFDCFLGRLFLCLYLVPRALSEMKLPAVRAHLGQPQVRVIRLTETHVKRNPHALRLVAAAPEELAYETLLVGKSVNAALNEYQ